MRRGHFRFASSLLFGLAILSIGSPSLAQAPASVPAQQQAPAAASPVPSEIPLATEDAPKPAPANGPLQRELSPWSMFLAADIVVKAVMIGLAFASVLTWTVFLAKTVELSFASRRLKGALRRIAQSKTLAEARIALGARESVLSLLLLAAVQEIEMSSGALVDSGVKERAASRFAEMLRADGRAIRRGMGLLATIGSTSPFVGLFGTVWGIMNSFIGISKSQTTNLAVVAPGIAEALLATAFGLVAAIPAVILYNHFARKTKAYLDLVAGAAGAVGRLLSRDLDRAHGGTLPRAAE